MEFRTSKYFLIHFIFIAVFSCTSNQIDNKISAKKTASHFDDSLYSLVKKDKSLNRLKPESMPEIFQNFKRGQPTSWFTKNKPNETKAKLNTLLSNLRDVKNLFLGTLEFCICIVSLSRTRPPMEEKRYLV